MIGEFTRRGIIIGDYFISGDYHLGYEKEQQFLTSADIIEDITSRLETVITNNDISTIVINGDIFHPFADQHQVNVQELQSYIRQYNIEVIFIRGNHDTADILDYVDYITFQHNNNKILVTHGHQRIDNESADYYILNHLHPVLSVYGTTWPTYLVRSSKNDTIYILPAFSKYQDGVSMTAEIDINIDFPYVDNYGDFTAFVYDDQQDTVREFTELRDLSKYL